MLDQAKFRGTMTSNPPEQDLLDGDIGQIISQKYDVWSIGVLTYYLLTGAYPFLPPIAASGRIEADDIKELRQKGTFEYPRFLKTSKRALRFIFACLRNDPDSRPSFKELWTTSEWLLHGPDETTVDDEDFG